jgi:putative Mg2+ transporter-C (MgtC) family protein
MLPSQADLAMAGQVLLAGLLAAAVGWQRHRVGRPAGLRTHALVAMAAACFALAGFRGFDGPGPHDPTRIAAQVASGIGFLGAGTILRSRDRVRGLTTAATLWLAAALGVLVVAGLAWIAVFTTLATLIVLIFARRFERPVAEERSPPDDEPPDVI